MYIYSQRNFIFVLVVVIKKKIVFLAFVFVGFFFNGVGKKM